MTATLSAEAARESPASYAQQRLWIIDRLLPGSTAYNVTLVADISGPVSHAALEASFAEEIRRHEGLRTSFRVRGGRPVQVVSARVEPRLAAVDLRDLAPAVQARTVEQAVRALSETPFDLERPPLWSLALLSLAEQAHVLVMVVHHIIFDQASEEIVVGELAQLYDASVRGLPFRLAPPAAQYPDVSTAQRARLDGPALDRLLAFWRGQLEGGDSFPASALPFRRGAGVEERGPGRTVRTTLAGRPLDALRVLARARGRSLFTVALAAFLVLLHRYTGGGKALVAVPVSSRDRVGLESVVGLLVNLVPLCVEIDDRETFLTALDRVGERVLAALEHQDLPFEKIVEALDPARYYGGTRLEQVVVGYRRRSRSGLEAGGLRIAPRDAESGRAKFELSLMVVEDEDALDVTVEYAPACYEDADVQRLLRNYRGMLARVGQAADVPVHAMPLLSHEDETLQVETWNGAAEAPPAWDEGIVGAIERVARRQPDAIAARNGDDALTYGALAARSGRLAAWLRSHGAGPETLVGVAVDRSVETVVALVGVIRSGAAYVALDAAAPAARLQALAREAGLTRVVVPARRHEAVVAALASVCPVVDLASALDPRAGARTTIAGRRPIDPDALAYVLFTSGSTGRPKGVMVGHRSLAASTAARPAYYGPAPPSFLMVSPFFFDSSVAGLFWTLTSGGCLVLPEEGDQRDPGRLAQQCLEERVTHLLCIPALYDGLVDALCGAAGALHVAIVAGEACAPGLVEKHRATLAAVRLYNEYGPTEGTVWSTVSRLDAPGADASPHAAEAVPIGRAVETQRVYLTDARGRLLPIGARGEIVVGGTGVARGYWRQPAATAARFVPDAWTGAGRRVYRTGDWARWRGDGQLLFDGRRDDEVKIRGHRLSLGEVESLLVREPGVAAAAAVVRDERGGPRLLAFVALRDGACVTGEMLRAHLAQRLPAALVPAVVRVLPALPTLPTGKLDRRRLLEIAAREEATIAGQAPLLDPIEGLVADVWKEILGREEVAPDDNFFEIGGHSLLATQVVGRIRALFDRPVLLRTLFENPTVRALAEQLKRAHVPEPVSRDAPGLRRLATRDRVPLSFQQQRLWYLYEADRAGVDYHLPRAVRLRGPLAVGVLARAIDEIIRRHEILRTSFAAENGRPYMMVHAPAPFVLPACEVPGATAAERLAHAVRLMDEQVRRPFELEREAARFVLYRLDADDHILFTTMHHIVTDGWSLGVLTRELQALYAAFRRNGTSPLPELPLQYGDFSAWQRDWLQGDRLNQYVEYWDRALDGASAGTLAQWRPGAARQRFAGRSLHFTVDAGIVARLRALCRETGSTLYMALHGLFAASVAWHAGVTDVVVGTSVANRRDARTEGLIGFFANTVPMRTSLDPEETFRAFLARARQRALDAFALEDVPMESVVARLRRKGALERDAALFDTFFVLHNEPVRPLVLPDLEADVVEIHNPTTMFQLAASATERDGGLEYMLHYDANDLGEETVRALGCTFERLLGAAGAAPDDPVLDALAEQAAPLAPPSLPGRA